MENCMNCIDIKVKNESSRHKTLMFYTLKRDAVFYLTLHLKTFNTFFFNYLLSVGVVS